MTNVDISSWAKTNVWMLSSGEMAVRPGLRRHLAPDASRIFCGGVSVLNQFTGEAWHYVFDCTSSVSTSRGLRLQIYDDDFVIFQTLTLGVNADPRTITLAVVEGQILICSPDFPTLWGLVGSMMILAVKVASTNPSTTALDVPRGIVSAFCNRFVIADGPSLYFSDPIAATGGDGRTFVAQNQNQRPSPIFGLHEGAGGQLIVVTQRGTYGLDASASAVGILGNNGTAWQLLNHAESNSFNSSCSVAGRVFALCQNGYKLVDIEGDSVEVISDPMLPRAYGPRIAADDWRGGRMFGGDLGPVVSMSDSVSMHDLAGKCRSWWNRPQSGTAFAVRGMLKSADGIEFIMAEDGIYEPVGNYDADDLTETAAAAQPKGVFTGRVPSGPGQNTTIRSVRAVGSLGGTGSIYVAVRADAQSDVPPADARALVVGTSSWGAAGVIYEPAPLAAVRWQGALNSHDIGIEIALDFCDTRTGTAIDVGTSESATNRPGERGQ